MGRTAKISPPSVLQRSQRLVRVCRAPRQSAMPLLGSAPSTVRGRLHHRNGLPPIPRFSFPVKPLCLLAPPVGRDENKRGINMDLVKRLSRALVVVFVRLSRNRRLAAESPK